MAMTLGIGTSSVPRSTIIIRPVATVAVRHTFSSVYYTSPCHVRLTSRPVHLATSTLTPRFSNPSVPPLLPGSFSPSVATLGTLPATTMSTLASTSMMTLYLLPTHQHLQKRRIAMMRATSTVRATTTPTATATAASSSSSTDSAAAATTIQQQQLLQRKGSTLHNKGEERESGSEGQTVLTTTRQQKTPQRRTILITGGDRGIGYEVSRGVVAAGCRAVIACRDPQGSGLKAARRILRDCDDDARRRRRRRRRKAEAVNVEEAEATTEKENSEQGVLQRTDEEGQEKDYVDEDDGRIRVLTSNLEEDCTNEQEPQQQYGEGPQPGVPTCLIYVIPFSLDPTEFRQTRIGAECLAREGIRLDGVVHNAATVYDARRRVWTGTGTGTGDDGGGGRGAMKREDDDDDGVGGSGDWNGNGKDGGCGRDMNHDSGRFGVGVGVGDRRRSGAGADTDSQLPFGRIVQHTIACNYFGTLHANDCYTPLLRHYNYYSSNSRSNSSISLSAATAASATAAVAVASATAPSPPPPQIVFMCHRTASLSTLRCRRLWGTLREAALPLEILNITMAQMADRATHSPTTHVDLGWPVCPYICANIGLALFSRMMQYKVDTYHGVCVRSSTKNVVKPHTAATATATTTTSSSSSASSSSKMETQPTEGGNGGNITVAVAVPVAAAPEPDPDPTTTHAGLLNHPQEGMLKAGRLGLGTVQQQTETETEPMTTVTLTSVTALRKSGSNHQSPSQSLHGLSDAQRTSTDNEGIKTQPQYHLNVGTTYGKHKSPAVVTNNNSSQVNDVATKAVGDRENTLGTPPPPPPQQQHINSDRSCSTTSSDRRGADGDSTTDAGMLMDDDNKKYSYSLQHMCFNLGKTFIHELRAQQSIYDIRKEEAEKKERAEAGKRREEEKGDTKNEEPVAAASRLDVGEGARYVDTAMCRNGWTSEIHKPPPAVSALTTTNGTHTSHANVIPTAEVPQQQPQPDLVGGSFTPPSSNNDTHQPVKEEKKKTATAFQPPINKQKSGSSGDNASSSSFPEKVRQMVEERVDEVDHLLRLDVGECSRYVENTLCRNGWGAVVRRPPPLSPLRSGSAGQQQNPQNSNTSDSNSNPSSVTTTTTNVATTTTNTHAPTKNTQTAPKQEVVEGGGGTTTGTPHQKEASHIPRIKDFYSSTSHSPSWSRSAGYLSDHALSELRRGLVSNRKRKMNIDNSSQSRQGGGTASATTDNNGDTAAVEEEEVPSSSVFMLQSNACCPGFVKTTEIGQFIGNQIVGSGSRTSFSSAVGSGHARAAMRASQDPTHDLLKVVENRVTSEQTAADTALWILGLDSVAVDCSVPPIDDGFDSKRISTSTAGGTMAYSKAVSGTGGGGDCGGLFYADRTNISARIYDAQPRAYIHSETTESVQGMLNNASRVRANLDRRDRKKGGAISRLMSKGSKRSARGLR